MTTYENFVQQGGQIRIESGENETSPPTYRLDVSGNINFSGNLYQNGSLFTSGDGGGTSGSIDTSDFASLSSSNTFASNQIINGNVGIGGSVGINTSTPSEKFHIRNGNLLIDNTENSGKFLMGTVTPGGYIDLYSSSNVNVVKIRSYAVNNVQAFFNAGNIGIGTTSPSEKLEIYNGNLRLSSTTGCKIHLDSDINNSPTNDDNILSGPHIRFSQDNALIKSSLGTTQTDGYDAEGIATTGVVRNSTVLKHTYEYGNIQFANDGGVRMTIKGDGNVGIGKTSPSYKLDVVGQIATKGVNAGDSIAKSHLLIDSNSFTGVSIRSDRTTGYVGGYQFFNSSDVRTAEMTWNYNGKLQLWNINDVGTLTETMTIERNSNVGIGTTSPSSKLHVNGTVRASGFIPFTGKHIVYTDENHDSHTGLIVSTTGQIPKITINDVWPYIRLANKVNDKAVFGVMSSIDTNEEQYTINSLGEGGIWVSDINGSFENGDYITSSILPGYGQKQDDDFLHNYTVAKIIMDCDFTQPSKPKIQVKTHIVDYEEEEDVLDASGNVVYETVQVLDESGNPILEYVPKLDASGNDVYETITLTDASGEPLTEMVPLLDESGNTMLDVCGNTLMEEVEQTETQQVMIEQVKTEQSVKRIMVTKTKEENILDEQGKIIWETMLDASGNSVMEPAYDMRYLLVDGTEITKEEYDQEDGLKYRAAFVGCTYHCG